MPEELQHADGQPVHPNVRFETRDANLKWIAGLLVGAMAFAALVHYILLVFFFDYGAYQAQIKQSPYPLAPKPSESLPANPRLEQIDRLEHIQSPNVYERQASREAILDSYGPTNDKGYVHIPIDRAITLAAKQLKARAPQANPKGPGHAPLESGESNSGRQLREVRP